MSGEGWQKINLWASAVALIASVVNALVLTVDVLRPFDERLLLVLCAVLLAAQLVAAAWLVVSAINVRKCVRQETDDTQRRK